jgi:hypothetical protein
MKPPITVQVSQWPGVRPIARSRRPQRSQPAILCNQLAAVSRRSARRCAALYVNRPFARDIDWDSATKAANPSQACRRSLASAPMGTAGPERNTKALYRGQSGVRVWRPVRVSRRWPEPFDGEPPPDATTMTAKDALGTSHDTEPGDRLHPYQPTCKPRGACRREPLANDPGRTY